MIVWPDWNVYSQKETLYGLAIESNIQRTQELGTAQVIVVSLRKKGHM